MPPKIRELKSRLMAAGFMMRSGKGSHTVWTHAKSPRVVSLSGQDGDDAKPYQEKQVAQAINQIEDPP